jgi:hypothetical protein
MINSVSIGRYIFIADVYFYQTSPDSWTLSTDLYYIGPDMADVSLNYNTYLSANGEHSGSQDFIRTNAVITSADVHYLGRSNYTVAGSNSVGDFTLNIHAGAII